MPSSPRFGQLETDAAPQMGLFSEPSAPETKPPREKLLGELLDERARERAADGQTPRAEAATDFLPIQPGVDAALILHPQQPEAGATEPPQAAGASQPESIPRPASSSDPGRARKRGRPGSGASSLPAWAYASRKPAVVPSPAARPILTPGNEVERELADDPAPQPAQQIRRIWTVADLVGQVRAHIEQTWADLWVHGEISNLRTAPSGHLYFTLKDGESQLPAVLFRRQAQLLRFRPEDGLEVLLRGKVSVYEQRGQMQLIAEYLEPVGAGSLQIAFEQLKARLSAEGLFDASRKRDLPAYPRCVGIVTSPGGAVIRDFLNVAGRRHAALDVLLYPAVVQGSSAAAEVAAGIAYFNRAKNVDVIVIARGGGSLEDLSPFNTELLARAIAASALPVVSAIGHETDFTIADFVADLRAPTPSAAAELITAAQHRVEEQVSALAQRLERACRYLLILARQRFGALPMQPARMFESINRREQRVDALRFRMEAALRTQLHAASARVAQCSVNAAVARMRGMLGERGRVVESLRFRLQQAHALHLRLARERLQGASSRLLQQDAGHRLRVLRGQWSALDERLERQAGELLRRPDGRCQSLDERLRRVALEQLRDPNIRYQSLFRQLESLSPLAVLSRGYALVFDEQRALVKRAVDVHAGEILTLRLAEGEVRSRVENQS